MVGAAGTVDPASDLGQEFAARACRSLRRYRSAGLAPRGRHPGKGSDGRRCANSLRALILVEFTGIGVATRECGRAEGVKTRISRRTGVLTPFTQPGRGIKPRSDELVGPATNTVALIVPGVLIETTSANSLFSQLRA